ncbi:MAG: hypothetical protein AAB676_19550, partial [Verrucomicrobiota bacterium]
MEESIRNALGRLQSLCLAQRLKHVLLWTFLASVSMTNLWSATVTWDAGGSDKSWHNPQNWAGDIVPGSTDDVVVQTSNLQLEVRSSVTIRGLNLGNGVSLIAQGSGIRFTATSNAIIDGASISALQGATVSLPELTRYDLPEARSSYALWKADGPGSVLEFPN